MLWFLVNVALVAFVAMAVGLTLVLLPLSMASAAAWVIRWRGQSVRPEPFIQGSERPRNELGRRFLRSVSGRIKRVPHLRTPAL